LRFPEPDAGKWAGQLAEVARQMRAVIGRHRDLVPFSIGFLPGSGRALRCHERMLAIMRAGGLPDSRSVAGPHLLWVIVNGFSLEETRAGGTGATWPGPVTRGEPVLLFAARRPLPESGRGGGRVRKDGLRPALRTADQDLHQRAGRTGTAVMTGIDTPQHGNTESRPGDALSRSSPDDPHAMLVTWGFPG
jgi:hypothetical protein